MNILVSEPVSNLPPEIAIIGSLGVALYHNDDTHKVRRYSLDEDTFTDQDHLFSQLRKLCLNECETIYVKIEDLKQGVIDSELKAFSLKMHALDFLCQATSPDYSDELCRDLYFASLDIQEEFPEAREFVINRLLSLPPPQANASFSKLLSVLDKAVCHSTKKPSEDHLRRVLKTISQPESSLIIEKVRAPFVQFMRSFVSVGEFAHDDIDIAFVKLEREFIDNGTIAAIVKPILSLNTEKNESIDTIAQRTIEKIKFKVLERGSQLSNRNALAGIIDDFDASLNAVIDHFKAEGNFFKSLQMQSDQPADLSAANQENKGEQHKFPLSNAIILTWQENKQKFEKERKKSNKNNYSTSQNPLDIAREQIDYLFDLFLKQKSINKIDQELSKFVEKNLQNGDSLHLCKTLSNLADKLFRLNNNRHFEMVLNLYEMAQKSNHGDPVATCGYAETLKSMGRLEEALTTYEQAKQKFSDNPVAHNGYAETLKSMGRLEEALKTYEQAKQQFTYDPVAACGYAETLKSMGRLEEALTTYEQAKQQFTHDPVAACGYAETLKSMGRLEEALTTYEQTKQQFSDNPVAVCGYAEILKSMGRLEEALTTYEQTKQQFSDNPVAVCGYAEILKSMGRLEEALKEYEKAKQQFTYDPVAACGYAETLKSMGRLEEALTTYEQAKQKFSDNPVAACGYAETLKSMGRLQEALTTYEQAKQQFTHDPVAHNGYAETLKSMGRLQEALTTYEQAKQQFTHDPVAHNGYAETLKSMGRLQEALITYEQAKQQFTNNPVTHNGYAETLKSMGRLEEALTTYEQAKKQFTNDPVAACGYAETLKSMGRLQEALELYKNIHEKFPYNRVIRSAFAKIYIILEKYEKAAHLVSTHSTLATESDWRDFYLKISALLWQNKITEALQSLAEHKPSDCPFNKTRALLHHLHTLALYRDNQMKQAEQLYETIDIHNVPAVSVGAKLIKYQIDRRVDADLSNIKPAKEIVSYIPKEGDGKKIVELAEKIDLHYQISRESQPSSSDIIVEAENDLLLDLPDLNIPIDPELMTEIRPSAQ